MVRTTITDGSANHHTTAFAFATMHTDTQSDKRIQNTELLKKAEYVQHNYS
eukprot:m.1659866 g.1659866  ORF g.1659866 m.1659866 type:complete len:51 (-) comp120118_c0_seq1:126-278(-)